MKHKLVVILLIILTLGLASFLYINKYFLPIRAKEILIEKAQEVFKRKVAFKDIHFNFLKGFTIREFTVYEKGSSDIPFINVEEMSAGILYAPLFQNKKIIIPSIKITHPSITVIRSGENTWNFSDLIPSPGKKPESPDKTGKSPFSFYLSNLSLESGTIRFIDRSQAAPFQETIENLDIQTNLSLKKSIIYTILANVPKQSSTLKIDGEYELETGKLSAQAWFNKIHLGEYLSRYLKISKFQWKIGNLVSANMTIEALDKNFELYGAAEVQGADFIVSGKEYRGDLKTTVTGLSLRDDVFKLKTDLTGHAVSILLAPDHQLNGDVKISSLNMEWQGNTFKLESDIAIENADFRLGEKNTVTGNLKSEKILVSVFNNAMQLNGDIDAQDLGVRFGDEGKFTGALTTPSLSFRWQDETAVLKADLNLKSALLHLQAQKEIQGELTANETTLIIQKDTVDLKSKLTFASSLFKMGASELSGSADLDLHLNFNPQGQTHWAYDGCLDSKKMDFVGLPYVEEAKDIEGKIDFANGKVSSKELKGTIADSPVELTGSVTDLSHPYLDIKAKSQNVNLALLNRIFPQVTKTLQIEPAGTASFDLSFKGLLNAPKEADVTLKAVLNEATLKGDKIPDGIQKISGTVNLAPNFISWEKLNGIYQGKQYTLSGTLENFSRPVLKTSLHSENFNFDTNINILNNAFQIILLKGKYFKSTFDVKGDVHILDGTTPVFNLIGHTDLQLEDLKFLFPSLRTAMDWIKLKGPMGVNASFRGTPKDWRNWSVLIKGTSQGITLAGYKFTDVALTFDERDQNINKCDLTATLYGGKVTLKSSADLTSTESPYRMNLNLEDVNLAKMRKDFSAQNNDIAGHLIGFAVLHGNLKDFKDSQGNGNVSITDGYLWQLNLLGGLGKLLLIPEYQDIVFTEATTNFTIKNQKTRFENMELVSRPLTLKGSGTIDLQSNIDFSISSHFDMAAIAQSPSLKKTFTALLTTTHSYLNIKITGTLQHPQHRFVPSPVNVLEKTTDLLKEGIQSIF